MSKRADFTPLWNFINERHAIYLRKTLFEGGEIPKWANPAKWPIKRSDPNPAAHGQYTTDPILSKFRFCNVFRELDRVTIWINKNIKKPWKDHPNLWYMLAIARTLNWPPTLEELIGKAWPLRGTYTPAEMSKVLNKRKERGDKVTTGAYLIRPESDPKKEWYSWTKSEYLCEIVLGNLWKDRLRFQELLNTRQGSLQRVHTVLMEYHGWGSFMAGQLVTDLRHSRYLEHATDINTWTALGPGSRRGLNRLHGRDVKAALSQKAGLAELIELRKEAKKHIKKHVPLPELSDIQNCCCEVDKYLRVKTGEGEPRALYVRGRGW